MAHAWKACWVQALGGSNPPSSATGPRDRFRFRGFCCLWRRVLWVPLVFRAPSGPAAREIATREPDGSEWSISKPARALRTLRRPPHRRRLVADVWLGASSRSPARPRRRSPAPRPGPPGPPVPSTPATLVVLCAPAGNRAVTALPSPGLVPLDSEALDDLCARECGQDLARHKELRAAQARADAAPSDRARRVDEEPP